MTLVPPALSIVIPVGPGDHVCQDLLRDLAGFPGTCQVVLSTCEDLEVRWPKPVAREIELVKISGPPGRAGQLNRGIAAASAPCLWLLHADSRPDSRAMAAAAEFAHQAAAPGRQLTLAWFTLAFAPDGPRLTSLNAIGANLRSRVLGMPFGDQAWLMSPVLFERAGGFDEEFGRGEDLDFIVRARRAGAQLYRLQPAIRSSARRYRDQGWLQTTLAHLWLTLRLWLKARRRAGNRISTDFRSGTR